MKVPKGYSFIEFYYHGLSINTSGELLEFIQDNKWYFYKMSKEIQEQFRRKYKKMQEKERLKWQKE